MHKNILCHSMRTAVAALLALNLAGCAATQDGTEGLYKIEAGPFATGVVDSLVLNDALQDRDVSLRIVYPEDAGPSPLVVFSSGAFCYPQMYDRITGHWASHGYIVVLPNHLDSPNLGKINPKDLAILLSARVRDMSFVLDSINDIESATGLEIDRDRIAVGGHSFGSMIAKIKSGLHLKPDQYMYPGKAADSRFSAAVVMSGVGQMEQMREDAFAGLTGPLIAMGGTLDTGNVGTGVVYPWEWRMSGYTLAPPGDKYSVVLENADHYLGGLICRDNRGGEADPEGVAIDRAMTTAFLDAYINEDKSARFFLNTADVAAITDGRATYEKK